jgi:hypothetical protein
MEQWWMMIIAREELKNSEETILKCYFLHHESHLKSPEIEPGSPR